MAFDVNISLWLSVVVPFAPTRFIAKMLRGGAIYSVFFELCARRATTYVMIYTCTAVVASQFVPLFQHNSLSVGGFFVLLWRSPHYLVSIKIVESAYLAALLIGDFAGVVGAAEYNKLPLVYVRGIVGEIAP